MRGTGNDRRACRFQRPAERHRQGDHVGLLGVEISAHVFQQLLHGGHVSGHFVGLAGFFNCLCSLIALRCFAFVQRHDVIIARLGGFLRFGLGRLGCFLRVRVCSIGSAVLIIFLQRVEEDLDVFDLLPPLFRSALQNVAVGELGCRVGRSLMSKVPTYSLPL